MSLLERVLKIKHMTLPELANNCPELLRLSGGKYSDDYEEGQLLIKIIKRERLHKQIGYVGVNIIFMITGHDVAPSTRVGWTNI